MKKHKTILFRVYKNITRYNQKNMSNPITKEEEDEQSPSVIEPSAGNPNMPLPPFQEQKTQALSEQQQPTVVEESSSRSNPQQETTSQPIAATTAAGVTAPKPKVDFTATDATIQGLLIQAIALYHNKTQQQQQQQE